MALARAWASWIAGFVMLTDEGPASADGGGGGGKSPVGGPGGGGGATSGGAGALSLPSFSAIALARA